MNLKYLICYIGAGNSLIFKESFNSKQEAVDYLIATVGVEKFEHLKP